MSDSSRFQIENTKKLALYGISTVVAFCFGFYLYQRLSKTQRASSSSSDSGDDTALIQAIKGPSSSPNKNGRRYQNKNKNFSKNGQVRVKNSGLDRSDEINTKSKIINGRNINKRKTIYFDSNDEMFMESEISDNELINTGRYNKKNYTKVTLKQTEEEKQKLREILSKQKKHNIQQFLNDVNDKKNTFIHQKKRVFKEDMNQKLLNICSQNQKLNSNGSRTTSTQSEERERHHVGNNYDLNGQSSQRKNQYINQQMKQMRQAMNGNQNNDGIVNLSPEHFNNKERYHWFDLLTLYTKNFLNDEEKNEKIRQRQLAEKYYSGSSSKKRSASLE